MKVEVYKIYNDNTKILDSITNDGVTVSYPSSGFTPNGKFDSYDPSSETGTGASEVTNRFDSTITEETKSSVANVVIKYTSPEFIGSASECKLTAFKNESTGKCTFTLSYDFKDRLGLDTDVIEVEMGEGTPGIIYGKKRVFDGADDSQGEIESMDFGTVYAGGELLSDSDVYVGDFKITKTSPSSSKYPTYNCYFTLTFSKNLLGKIDDDINVNSINNTIYKSFLKSLRFSIYDLAGNKYTYVIETMLTPVNYTRTELIDTLSKLKVAFTDTYPSDYFIDTNIVGNTTLYVENPSNNYEITFKFGLQIVNELKEDSLGWIDTSTEEIEYYDDEKSTGEITKLVKIDSITESGYVKTISYLYNVELDAELNTIIQTATEASGELGLFFVECESNNRKINLDAMIPRFAENTVFYDFCKLIEKWLNTCYTPLGEDDCRIGILEKIERIGNFNDIQEIEDEAIKYYAKQMGIELDFDNDGLNKIRELTQKYNNVTTTNSDLLRSLYKKIPHINRYKGTIECYNIIFNTLGLHVKLTPLYGKIENGETTLVTKEEADDDFWLSSNLDMEIDSVASGSELSEIRDSILRLINSILPVVRVINELIFVDTSTVDTIFKIGYKGVTNSTETTTDIITYGWYIPNLSYKKLNDSTYTLTIPIYADLIEYEDEKIVVANTSETENTSNLKYISDNTFMYFKALEKTYNNKHINCYDEWKEIHITIAKKDDVDDEWYESQVIAGDTYGMLSGIKFTTKYVILTLKDEEDKGKLSSVFNPSNFNQLNSANRAMFIKFEFNKKSWYTKTIIYYDD